MATNTINENVEQAISDFGTIKQAIINKGVQVPNGTPTSQYATKIGEIPNGGSSSDEVFKAIIERTATTLTLPSEITKIGSNVFYFYNTLTYISMPGVTSIGNNAFGNCTNLALTSLPEGITSIEGGTFQNCSKLALTSLPSGVTSIGNSAFSSCKNLALTSLPSGITSIEQYSFNNCTKLALTSLPSGLTSIRGFAFGGCTGLTEITFEGTPTSLNSTAFYDCTNLTTIRVPWAEGEVAGAPWGASNASLIYSYTPETT